MRACCAHEHNSAHDGGGEDPDAVSQSEGRVDGARAPPVRRQRGDGIWVRRHRGRVPRDGDGGQRDRARDRRGARDRGRDRAHPAAHPQSTAWRRAEAGDGERPDAARGFAGAGRVDDARRSGVAAAVDRAEPAQPRGGPDAARAPDEHEDGGAVAQGAGLQPAGQSQTPRRARSIRIGTRSSSTSTRRCVDSWRRTSRRSRWTPRRRSWWAPTRMGAASCGRRAIPRTCRCTTSSTRSGQGRALRRVRPATRIEAWVSVGIESRHGGVCRAVDPDLVAGNGSAHVSRRAARS